MSRPRSMFSLMRVELISSRYTGSFSSLIFPLIFEYAASSAALSSPFPSRVSLWKTIWFIECIESGAGAALYDDALMMTSLPATRYSSLPGNRSFSLLRSFGFAIFTGKSSANRNTSASSATDIEIILRLSILGCVFFDHENSSSARYTSKPSSLIACTIPL